MSLASFSRNNRCYQRGPLPPKRVIVMIPVLPRPRHVFNIIINGNHHTAVYNYTLGYWTSNIFEVNKTRFVRDDENHRKSRFIFGNNITDKYNYYYIFSANMITGEIIGEPTLIQKSIELGVNVTRGCILNKKRPVSTPI